MTAVEIKRWFKTTFNIPVRVSTGSTKNPYQSVWISPKPTTTRFGPSVYDHDFPLDFGLHCLKIVYPGRDSLHVNWCGNVNLHRICMHIPEWEQAMATYVKPEPAAN